MKIKQIEPQYLEREGREERRCEGLAAKVRASLVIAVAGGNSVLQNAVCREGKTPVGRYVTALSIGLGGGGS
ncbi:hypothetical protein E2562_010272 [Oryza meyeriana var. granulata]|uniref:Uncharacterized protein n=1 Tax=Oryza meyeriana var. granulata TaxID=110450 RepID=A0A6G1EIL9_9ORYZ|nr:hypothetical protein E2562_010272 [Oryza meyeriana var. granulata]